MHCVSFSVMNAADYGVPQDRIRVFIVGIRNDLSIEFKFPEPTTPNEKHISLRSSIGDIKELPNYYEKESVQQNYVSLWNHDCYSGPYDKKFMARNRVRKWDEVSFTIQAQGRNAPIHPQAPPMIFVSPNERRFDSRCLALYRRLSVRECARIQSFPDSFHFLYNDVLDGYKMVGNAVPPLLAKHLAVSIMEQLSKSTMLRDKVETSSILVGYYRNDEQLRITKERQLYYVRTGFRPGAMHLPPGQESPEYLVLHKGKNMELFRLKKRIPVIMNREELENMGFLPHGDVYICFQIDESIDIKHLPLDKEALSRIRNSTSPYIMDCTKERLH